MNSKALASALMLLVSQGIEAQSVGSYRVTLNGFRVDRETYDTAFEADGKGDEVFVVSEAGSIDRTRAISQRVSRQSQIYGDANGFPRRIQAGRRSDQGGLKTGDRVPDRDLTQPRPTTARIGHDFLPMVLWNGNLTDGQNAVVIMPTIWEWDLPATELPVPGRPIPHYVPPESFLRGAFSGWLSGAYGEYVSQNIGTTFASLFAGPAERAGWIRERSNADILTMGTNGTRVIGLVTSRVYDTDVFYPKVLILTYAGAERSLRSGNCIFELAYDEPRCCGLEGSYTLFLQLERLPSNRLGPQGVRISQ
jgi:hypothetical protein